MLSKSCKLVKLTKKKWSATKADKNLRESLANITGGDKSHLGASKKLVDYRQYIKPIATLDGWFQNQVIQKYCLPWDQDGDKHGGGWWLLPNGHFEKVFQLFDETKQKRQDLVNSFLDSYERAKAEARHNLGSAFNLDDYPTRDELEEKFRFEIIDQAVPEAGDPRLDIPKYLSDRLVSEAKQRERERTDKALQDVSNRVIETAKHLSDKLKAYNPENKRDGYWNDSTVEAVQKCAEIVAISNINGSAKIESARQKMLSIGNVSSEDLREDEGLRESVTETLDSAVRDAMSSADERKQAIDSLFT